MAIQNVERMTMAKAFSDLLNLRFPKRNHCYGLLLVFCLGACKTPSSQIPTTPTIPWPTQDWPISTPEKEEISAQPFAELHQKTSDGIYGYVDRILVIKNGKIIVNHFYNNDYKTISKGKSGALGCGFETCKMPSAIHHYNYYHPDFHPYPKDREVHSLQSVTKSVAATLIGVAIQQGKIKDEQQPLLIWFENYDLSKVDKRLKNATLHHLLTMQSGIEWHEQDRPLDETNTTLQLERSDDWIQFTLNQPMDAEPGEKWVYSSGGSHLLSGIIKSATGMFIDEYAEKYLFNPLGISDYHWKKTPKGYPDTEGGLFLKAEDLAKIGWLYLNDGKWENQQLLPKGWAKKTTAIQIEKVNKYGWGYGYQWWRIDNEDTEIWAGLGFGDQFLFILPEKNIIAVVNSWNIFDRQRDFIFKDLFKILTE